MRILLTGASGQLGAYLIAEILGRGHEIVALSGTETGPRQGIDLRPLDLTNARAIDEVLTETNPDAIIHAAALSAAEAVRRDPIQAQAVNVDATNQIAGWANRHDRRLVFTSTDLVFDGSRPWNREEDPAGPILAYGRTKLEAEAAVLSVDRGIVARVSLLFGVSRCGRPYFFDRAIQAIQRGEPQSFFEDEYRTPLDLATAAAILVSLAESDLAGTYHVAGPERVSRYDLMRRAVLALGLDGSLVRPGKRADVDMPEPRPADVSLDTRKLVDAFPDLHRPTIEVALGRRTLIQGPGQV